MIGQHSSPFRFAAIAAFGAMLIGGDLRAEPQAAIQPGEQSVRSHDDWSKPALSDEGQASVGSEEIHTLVPMLMPLSEQKQLAGEIRALLRNGEGTAAAHKLTLAIEVGTLASILLDWIAHPALLAALDALPGLADRGDQATVASLPAAAETSVLTAALDAERGRAAALGNELRATKVEYQALKTSREQEVASALRTTSELQAALKRQEERAEAAAREIARVTQEFALMKTQREKDSESAAAHAAALTMARKSQEERADASARELETLSKELTALRTVREHEAQSAASEMANLQQALARERRRADEMMRELATRVEELRAREKADARPRSFSLDGVMIAGPAEVAAGLLGAPAPVFATGAIGAPLEDDAASAPGAIDATSVSRAAPSSPTDARLTARAEALFRSGDVSGARLLLERAQQAGNAQATFLLAETFDPNALSTIGAVGIPSDPAKARELYRRALALGVPQAGARMEALK